MSAPTEYQTNGPIGTGGMHAGHGPAPKKRGKFRKFLPAAIAVFALLIGIGIGSGNTPEPVTIEKEVPGPERVVTKTEKVNVPVTPESCLTALTLNEQAFTYASDSLDAILASDYAAAGTATSKMTALTPKVNAAKADCRASAK